MFCSSASQDTIYGLSPSNVFVWQNEYTHLNQAVHTTLFLRFAQPAAAIILAEDSAHCWSEYFTKQGKISIFYPSMRFPA